MDSFEKECARCNGKGQTAPPAQRVPGSSSSPASAPKSRTKPVWIYVFGLVSLAAIIALGMTALFRPKPEPKIAATVVQATPAPVVPAQAPAPTPIQQYAPPSEPVRTPQAPPRNVRPVTRQPDIIVQPPQPQPAASGMTSAEIAYSNAFSRWIDTLNASSKAMLSSQRVTRTQWMTFFAQADGVWMERLQYLTPPRFAAADSLLGDGLAQVRQAKLMYQLDGRLSTEMENTLVSGATSIDQSDKIMAAAVNRIQR